MQGYVVYILQCADQSLYTGIARDLEHRLQTHQAGKGSRYVASRLPFTLIYHESQPSRSDALKREYAIKRLSRSKKLSLCGLPQMPGD